MSKQLVTARDIAVERLYTALMSFRSYLEWYTKGPYAVTVQSGHVLLRRQPPISPAYFEASEAEVLYDLNNDEIHRNALKLNLKRIDFVAIKRAYQTIIDLKMESYSFNTTDANNRRTTVVYTAYSQAVTNWGRIVGYDEKLVVTLNISDLFHWKNKLCYHFGCGSIEDVMANKTTGGQLDSFVKMGVGDFHFNSEQLPQLRSMLRHFRNARGDITPAISGIYKSFEALLTLAADDGVITCDIV